MINKNKLQIEKCIEYERLVRKHVSDSMVPIAIGIILFPLGILSMAPINAEDGLLSIYIFYGFLLWMTVDLYMKMGLLIKEQQDGINIFAKYQMIPVKKEFLLEGKKVLLTRFVVKCGVVFQALNLLMRLLIKDKVLCIEAFIPTLIFLAVYIIERIQLRLFAKDLLR